MNNATEKLNKELTTLEPDTIIELFEIDFSSLQNHIDMLKLKNNLNIGSEPVYRFHSGKNLSNPIYWQDKGYQPLPILLEDMESKGDGTLPRPKLSILNVDGLLSRIVSSNDDFVGCTVTRKRTFAKFLDAKNFQNRNLNEDAENPFGRSDPQAHLPNDIFFINRKVLESKDIIQFELSSALELGTTTLPGRTVTADYCTWKYRCAVGCRYGVSKGQDGDEDAPRELPKADTNNKLFVRVDGEDSWGIERLRVETTEDIKEWSQFGILKKDEVEGASVWESGSEATPYGYSIGDVVKISPTYAKTQVDEVPLVFVCVQTHGTPSEYHPLMSKKVWVRDSCSKTLEGCMLRYGYKDGKGNPGAVDREVLRKPLSLPFGGFPGTVKFGH